MNIFPNFDEKTKSKHRRGRPCAKSMSKDSLSSNRPTLLADDVQTIKPDDQQGCPCHLALSPGARLQLFQRINKDQLPAKLPNSNPAPASFPSSASASSWSPPSCLLPPPLPLPAKPLPPPLLGQASPRREPSPRSSSGGQDGGRVGAACEQSRQRERLPRGDGGAGGGAHQPHGDGAAHRSVPVLHGLRLLEGREARRPSRVSPLYPLVPLRWVCALFGRVRRLDWIGGGDLARGW